MKRQQDEEAGFTLLEMLVAMTLFSLILSFFGALFYRMGTTNAAISRIERMENVDVVRRHLLQGLEGIRPHSYVDTNGIRKVLFSGEPSRVAFIGVGAGDRETGGLYETKVWLEPEGKLLLQRQPFGWGQGLDLKPEVLLDNVGSIEFSYFPCPSEAQSADVHRWANPSQLPSQITLTATFKAGDVRDWREIDAFVAAASCSIGG